jgi:hypothetical protein
MAEMLVPHLFVRIEHVGALDQLAELDDEHRARWLSASSRQKRSYSSSTDSSWRTWGAAR